MNLAGGNSTGCDGMPIVQTGEEGFFKGPMHDDSLNHSMVRRALYANCHNDLRSSGFSRI
jgi:hypothetical protein